MPRYSDIDFLLVKNEFNNDINLKYDVAAISQSIKNILLTTQKEKLFNPLFGGNAYDLIFNTFGPVQLEVKKEIMKSQIELNEPRAQIQNINIIDSGLGYWQITVTYSPIYDPSVTRDLNLTVGSN